MLGITDEAVALDFDGAAAFCLQQWEDERAINLAIASNPFAEPPKAKVEYEGFK
jgi:hypothetical protein